MVSLVSYGEYVGEGVGEGGEDEEPNPDRGEDPSAPRLDPGCLRFETFEGLFLCPRYAERGGENKADEGDGGDHERHECRLEASYRERVAGQTGQDRPGSAKPGKYVTEPEHGEPCHGPVSS